MKKRDEIEEKYKWDLTKIYVDNKAFINYLNKVSKEVDIFLYDESKIIKDACYLYSTYSSIIDLKRKIEKLYSYVILKHNEDLTNNESIKNLDMVTNLISKFEEKIASFNPTLLTLDYEDIKKMYKKCDKLLEFERSFEMIFRYKKYTLSKAEEEMITKLQKALEDNYTVYNNLVTSDIDFGKIKDEDNKLVELNNTNYSIYIKSKDKRVRRDTFKTLYNSYKRFRNTFTSLIDGRVRSLSTISKIRGFSSSLEASLYNDELSIDVYNSLIKAVSNGLDPLHNYYRIRKEILGLKQMHIYDTNVPLFDSFNKKYTYEESQKMIKNSLSVLGKDYISLIDKAFNERWIDVYPNIGKRNGAFSAGGYDTFPYILTNFQGEYYDIETIVHELGHSIHSHYARENNPYIYGDYSIVVAEVASTVNELIFLRYVIDNSKNLKEKLSILDKLINLYKSTIYRQVMFAEFEKFIYDKRDNDEILTNDELEDYFYKLNEKYYGSSVIIDEEIRYEWERMPHLYYNFYVYKYATGLSCATFIVDNILKGNKDYLNKYFKFLKVGNKLSPNESLKIVGIDLNKKEVSERAIDVLDGLVKEYEEIYKEYKKSSD